MTVAAVLSEKGREVVTTSAAASIAGAIDTLAKHRIGALVVVDHDDRIVGILSERDVVRAIAAQGERVLSTPLSTVMTRAVVTCSESETINEVMTRMTRGRFRHLPVVDGDRLTGIISIGDVVKARIEQVERRGRGMRAYIARVGDQRLGWRHAFRFRRSRRREVRFAGDGTGSKRRTDRQKRRADSLVAGGATARRSHNPEAGPGPGSRADARRFGNLERAAALLATCARTSGATGSRTTPRRSRWCGQRLRVHVRDHQHLAACRIDGNGDDQPVLIEFRHQRRAGLDGFFVGAPGENGCGHDRARNRLAVGRTSLAGIERNARPAPAGRRVTPPARPAPAS